VLENDTTAAATRSRLVLVATVSSESWTTSLLFLNSRRNKLPEKIESNQTWNTNLIIFPDLPDEILESLVDIEPMRRGCLHEFTSKLLREITTLCHDRVVNTRADGWTCKQSGHTIYANHSLMFQVTLVRDDYNRKGVLVFDAEDLLMEGANFLNGVTRGDRVDEEEALSHADVLLPQFWRKHRSVKKSFKGGGS